MKTNDKNSKKRAAPPRYDEAFRARKGVAKTPAMQVRL